MNQVLLNVEELSAGFQTEKGFLTAVDKVSFTVKKGRTLGIVGESGCGKSVTAMSILRLLPQPAGEIIDGHIYFQGNDLVRASDESIRSVRGARIGMIFQEPMTALNPVMRIGDQLCEVFLLHKSVSKKHAWEESVKLLASVGIPSPEIRMKEYPHQLSGGMRQRVGIAIALACKPDLLIADEPTTALDVTIQAQILDLMKSLQQEMGMSIIMITHDLGVIAETCDDVVVMYAGRVAELGTVAQIFNNPRHLYTKGLLDSIPRLESPEKTPLKTIPGIVQSLEDMPVGARFAPRSPHPAAAAYVQSEAFKTIRPKLIEIENGHWVENCACVMV